MDCSTLYPLSSKDLIFLKHFITNPAIHIGDYTYYHDTDRPEAFEKENVALLYDCELHIGKFCQIAQGTKFIMSGANHQMNGFSTFPFFIFGDKWADYTPSFPKKGHTVVGNDVWFGHQSVIMPGIKIGDGAIIGAYAVVTKDVPPYSIVGGNPANIIRHRFDESTIKKLQVIQWWNWDVEKITRNIPLIVSADLEKLETAS
ncbi:putative acetyltransferase [Candidatus Protochlamydia naegleriophila]|uniref:Putative acetyltransferase n=1 Tax=Candidatus Protochlamydia naegleriophila TaxID=389348 RepID=A0A0U5JHU2_9BACT|nr:CatB-related O-acetyltransferase [Candidatus Protochlamydia naegleriophila]CUI17366.1 putative acetyltransferase [Candidatus Protochlamydia naegleriophila]